MSIETVKFRGRHISKAALAVLITGGISVILLIVMCIMASIRPEVPLFFGLMAMIAVVVSIFGLIISVLATKERDIYTSVPIAGMIVNGIALLLYVIIYFLGIV